MLIPPFESPTPSSPDKVAHARSMDVYLHNAKRYCTAISSRESRTSLAAVYNDMNSSHTDHVSASLQNQTQNEKFTLIACSGLGRKRMVMHVNPEGLIMAMLSEIVFLASQARRILRMHGALGLQAAVRPLEELSEVMILINTLFAEIQGTTASTIHRRYTPLF
ncbi:hypothetical protein Hypma_003374 [Hypsizygus marmoreus]|uniref:Uncharacterized protein n=1 Tax=Hypsizygus marmoreus TaxID=39966 RepID=A0A369J6B2_HYPMA|nr:hypothetical protein Hypma_003374 [Hypsizygus marmoreus]